MSITTQHLDTNLTDLTRVIANGVTLEIEKYIFKVLQEETTPILRNAAKALAAQVHANVQTYRDLNKDELQMYLVLNGAAPEKVTPIKGVD